MGKTTETGGRTATRSVIPGQFALSVGHPNSPVPDGYEWLPLSGLARLESGHTPSRSNSSYWGGEIPWVGIRDATGNHGRRIRSTIQSITQLGLDNSSARLLPIDTVCLSRTASVGYVVTIAVPMATSQDFVNWVCGPNLSPPYLHYLLMLEQESIRRFAHGTTHQTMYYPEAKALHVMIPNRQTQDAVTEVLRALDDKIAANTTSVSVASKLAVALMTSPATISLEEIASYSRRSTAITSSPEIIAHFSLPAFDAGQSPVLEPASNLKSSKFLIDQPSVLISKLNPRIPRIWHIPVIGSLQALASTEFMILEPRNISTAVLWATLAHPSVTAALQSRVVGTSGSHQRVKPADVLQIRIADPRTLSPSSLKRVTSLGDLINSYRRECERLAELRDALLPGLMSGRIKVKDAEDRVGEVL
jgi:type I restriction enzyme, S subunit